MAKLDGFSAFPAVLYPTGFGFKVSGYQLLAALHNGFGCKPRITLSADKPSSVNRLESIVRVRSVNTPHVSLLVSHLPHARQQHLPQTGDSLILSDVLLALSIANRTSES